MLGSTWRPMSRGSPGAERPGGVDVVLLPSREDEAAGEPDVGRRRAKPDGQRRVGEGGAQDRHEPNRQDEEGEREPGVRQTHHRLVDDPAVVARDQAGRDARPAIANRMDTTPACIEMRAPQMTRDRLSRPRSSVPKGCAQLGGFRIVLQLVAFGSAGASHGAASATTTNASTTTVPTTAGGRRARRRQASRRRSPRIPGRAARGRQHGGRRHDVRTHRPPWTRIRGLRRE